MDDAEKVRRGHKARNFRSNEAFEEVISYLIEEQWVMFQATEPLAKEEREKLYDFAAAIRGIKTTIDNWVFEAKEIEERNKEDGE